MATLNFFKLFCSFIIFFVLLIVLVSSSPPSLPVLIYGKVSFSDGKPFPDAAVVASWVKKDVGAASAKAMTLNSEKANLLGNQDLVGYYKFEIVDVIEGSEIEIKSNGASVNVKAVYGAQIRAPEIVVSFNEKKGFFENIFDYVKNMFIPSRKTSESLEAETDEGLDESYDGENESLDIEENISKKDKIFEDETIDKNFNISDGEQIERAIGDKGAPIIKKNISNIYICEGKSLSYVFEIDYPGKKILKCSLDPKYPLVPFKVRNTERYNQKIQECEIFSDVLSKEYFRDVNKGFKVYQETFSVDDGINVDKRNINITAIEINNLPSLDDIGVQTVEINKEKFYYRIKANDLEDGDENSGNLIFFINFSEKKLFDIGPNGIINFIPNVNHLGVYNITICVKDKGIKNPHENISLCMQDGKSIIVCNNFSLTVTNQNREPEIKSYSPQNLNLAHFGKEAISFNLTKYDADSTIPDSYWYVDNVLKKYNIQKNYEEFNYKVDCENFGEHEIKVEITDGKLNKSIEWKLKVNEENCYAPSIFKKQYQNILKYIKNLGIIILFLIFLIGLIVIIKLLINVFFLKIRLKRNK